MLVHLADPTERGVAARGAGAIDLGVFCPVVNNHNVASTNLDTFDPTWQLNRDFVKLAGWGGATQMWALGGLKNVWPNPAI
jgi:hypothetical protein